MTNHGITNYIFVCREKFDAGDSGSIIYIKNEKDKRIAVAILKGARHKPNEHIYDAIFLRAAMKCLENDYKHLVQSLALYTGEDSQNSPNARCGPVPVTAKRRYSQSS